MKTSTRDLVAYLDRNELKYAHRHDDEDLVMLGFTTRRLALSLLFICDATSVQLLCRMPFRAQPGQLDAVKEYFTRVNYWLRMGCFELDLRDGEMNFRIATFLANDGLGEDQAGRLMSTALGTVDRYVVGLQDVLFQQVAPDAAAIEARAADRDGVPAGVLIC